MQGAGMAASDSEGLWWATATGPSGEIGCRGEDASGCVSRLAVGGTLGGVDGQGHQHLGAVPDGRGATERGPPTGFHPCPTSVPEVEQSGARLVPSAIHSGDRGCGGSSGAIESAPIVNSCDCVISNLYSPMTCV